MILPAAFNDDPDRHRTTARIPFVIHSPQESAVPDHHHKRFPKWVKTVGPFMVLPIARGVISD
jgi:hypothetical protein